MALLEAGIAQDVEVIAMGRPEFDLVNPKDGLTAIAAVKPDVIVSAAAYTAVDRAESDAAMAYLINADGPASLAGLAAEFDIPIVHLSTDYVFDGCKLNPYVETDATNPLAVYGDSKLRGEEAIAAITNNHVILRTAWVYSPFGNNFLKTMLKLATTQTELRVVDDQRGNPTSALDIASAVIAIAKNLLARPNDANLRGIFHMVGTGEASWADFATEILEYSAGFEGPRADVKRISTAEYPTAARRPPNSRLNSTMLRSSHGIFMPDWKSSTHDIVRRLLDSGLA